MPGGQKKNLSLSMGKVQLCVTPSIVRVLLKVLSELKPAEVGVVMGMACDVHCPLVDEGEGGTDRAP